jgi:hypothetical protein
MQKPLALSIIACLGLAGCHVFEKSETWDQAVRVRPGETARDPDPSNAYAAKLHAAFAERGIEHKVVVYQYRYTTRLREEAVGTRTAVIYRDNSNGGHPWWLKDDRLNKPVWLPNGELSKQVSFYLRRKAEVIEQKEYPGQAGSAKSTVAFARPAPKLRPIAKPEPQAAVAKITPVKKAAAPIARKPTPAPARVTVKAPVVWKPVPKSVAVKPIEKPRAAKPVPKMAAVKPVVKKSVIKVAPAQIKPVVQPAPSPVVQAAPSSPIIFTPAPRPVEPESAPPEPIASRGASWSAPVTLDPSEQPALTAPRDRHLEKLFRAKHGTDYNRFSPADRRKMQHLQSGVASSE